MRTTWTLRSSPAARPATAALCAALLAAALPVAAPPAAATDTIGPPYLADADDPAVTTLASDLGIPIEEAQYRIGWQEPAIQLGEELYEALGEQFGGLWIDEAGGGRVKVGIVGGEPSPAAQALTLIEQRSLGPVSDIVPVQFSYAQLERDSAWLTTAIGEEAGTGPRLSSEMHVSGNRIVLLVPEDVALTAAQEAVVEQAEQQLGPRLAIETWSGSGQLQACSYMLGFNCDRPLRGGVRTFLDTNPPIYACTTGFNARSLSNGLWYVMTAGHCGDEGERFLAFQPARTAEFHLIGAVHNSVNVGNDDYAIIRIENVPGWNPRNWVYVHTGADTVINPVYSITGTSTSPEEIGRAHV